MGEIKINNYTIILYIFYFILEYYLFIDNEFDCGKYNERLGNHFMYMLIGSIALSILNYKDLKYIVVYFIMHIIIDSFIYWLNIKVKERSTVYLIYQILHIALIYYIGEILIHNSSNWIQLISNDLLRQILFTIVILRPINITFKILFKRYAPYEPDDCKNTIKGAGAMIGNLERLLTAIFMYYDQFGAIGLIFTAKSVARFDKISKDPMFAEYYLIGSLYSILSVLLFYGTIK